ncbi:hypothetical protein NA78x_000919 [Anatilimnocola sp. NA78]|uniref:hypothetical protein n=1 Tax=Anatilimnocola sp. NA78 TaxID=3415683 RepID=UPI003CE51048
MTTRAPLIIAIVLLLLPVLYVGTYLAMVKPRSGGDILLNMIKSDYRSGGDWESTVFWPLEQIDRRLRPETWRPQSYEYYGPGPSLP